MSYTVEELNPCNPVLEIDGELTIISLITLEKEVFFMENYQSVSNSFEVLREKPELLINFVWELVLDKSRFGNSFEKFNSFIFGSKDPLADVAKKMKNCFDESVRKSSPLIKNVKRYKELQEINKTQTDAEPCYATYYDSIAKRYGYTLQEFYGLTLGQLHILLKTINNEAYKELETQAALHGRKLKPRMEFKDISPEEEAEQEKDALDALARLQKEYEEKKKGK